MRHCYYYTISIFVIRVFSAISDIAILQIWTVMMALISVAWALTSYHRSVRYSRDDKIKLKYSAAIIAFIWHLMSARKFLLIFLWIIWYEDYYFSVSSIGFKSPSVNFSSLDGLYMCHSLGCYVILACDWSQPELVW